MSDSDDLKGLRAATLRKREMMALLESRGLRMRRRHGQNFAIDPNFLDGLVRSAEIRPDDVVLEIGHGLGVLTVRLAAVARHVVAVELDAAFAELGPKLAPEAENVTWIHADALGADGALGSVVVEALGHVGASSGRHLLVSNLPYRVATPIFIAALSGDGAMDGGCVTVQREVAERWTAEPGTREYGAASVGVQLLAQVRLLRRVPPEVFWPKPRVESAIVQFTAPRLPPTKGELDDIERTTKRLFAARRKTLTSALVGMIRGGNRGEAEALCSRAGLDHRCRAETLPPEAFRLIARFLLESRLTPPASSV